MGLRITGKHVNKVYDYSYHVLHLIRQLAYYVCGISQDICTEVETPTATGSLPLNTIKIYDIDKFVLTGYLFPNLLLHSDCNGYYDSTSKIGNDELLSGNINEFFEELTKIKLFLKEKEQDAWVAERLPYLNNLYDLVADEITYDEPYIHFS